MSNGELQAKCESCGTIYNYFELLNQVMYPPHASTIEHKPGMFSVPIQCGKCHHIFYLDLTDEQYTPFSEQIVSILEAMEMDDEPNWDDESHWDDEFPHDDDPSPPITSGELSENKLSQFKNIIKSIDKNLDVFERTNKIREALPTIIDEPSSDIEACFKLVKDEFKLNDRGIEAFKKDLNKIKAERELKKRRNKYNDVIERYSTPPKELSEQEKQEALTYLKDPNLINNISRDIGLAGEIVGEEINKMMIYLASISRKFKKPISLVIFGKSSSGKSYLVNAIEKFIPPEDKLILSSSSARAFEYLGDWLKHKFVLVQEWEGLEGILPTIRTLQSEGKLSRLVTIQNPDDKTYKSVAKSFECPCSVVVTTTKEGIHNENSTRIFELYADDTVPQTQNVVRQTILKASIKHRNSENNKIKILNLHHNIQRILEPIDVDIPFAQHLSFPDRTTRNRRDCERFMQLIKTVAYLRQKQKEIKYYNDVKCIEADVYDYEIAYIYGVPVISATLDQISERSKNVLRVCCSLMDDHIQKGQQIWFSVNQIQEKAPSLGFDLDNRQDLYKQLNALVEHEYLDLNQPKPKGTKYYTVIFNYVRDQGGNIINIGTPETKDITTPDFLKNKLANT